MNRLLTKQALRDFQTFRAMSCAFVVPPFEPKMDKDRAQKRIGVESLQL